MTQSKSDPVVVLPPPILSKNPLSNKYDLMLDVKWGTYEKTITINFELGDFYHRLIKELNQALLEGSESKPYDLPGV